MRTVYVILPIEHANEHEAQELENHLRLMLHQRGIEGSAKCYWEDTAFATEYGVRLYIDDLIGPSLQFLLDEIKKVESELHGPIRVQVRD